MKSPINNLELARFPTNHDSSLRAWDAADELVLTWLNDHFAEHAPALIINDSFGAISLGCHGTTSVSDSKLSIIATELNAKKNNLPGPKLIDAVSPLVAATGPVVVKIPKSMDLLAYQLRLLRAILTEGQIVVGTAMVKHLPQRAIELFEQIIGPTTRSLAKKKARLVFSHFDSSLEVPPLPNNQFSYEGREYRSHANVFSSKSIDIGTRFLLQHLPPLPERAQIADLGCGNGIIGIECALRSPSSEIHFFDESSMAIDSARSNWSRLIGEPNAANFNWVDTLGESMANRFDLVINNPPFHQGQVIGDFLAWNMFTASLRCLKVRGQLVIVGNRHLNYHGKLKKLFGHCETIASNAKFVVLRATKLR
ncbi:methyltransferase [uncultured Umboniibacter sp.]|uniref:methyltransferase n=1 Tax=uncultured Umboniibacter sp. TaxID=1798917 RepID=UPI0026214809|nr:methyltransferase [uncultured Umboniibacter sp.]